MKVAVAHIYNLRYYIKRNQSMYKRLKLFRKA